MEEKEKKEEEKKPEEETQEIPKGYYLTQVPTQVATVIALEDKQVSTEELIVKMANALKDNGLMKE